MTSNELRQKFLDFFVGQGHTQVPSSSLLPTDPSVLFTTAGMQQFKPYYTGEKSPYGDKVTSSQKCLRTVDIDEVGDDTHNTFFEMLGNFAFNNAVSKREAIQYAYDFITKELSLPIDYVTIFAGDDLTPRDTESEDIWKSIDANLDIREEGREDVFWGPTGDEGPCGPTTEIYINDVEIWNIVFNEYYCDADKNYKKLDQFGIDTGMGLERLLVAVQEKNNIFETDLFADIVGGEKGDRILADHLRASLFMVSDGVTPSNTGQGYILRRLIRRAARYGETADFERVINFFKDKYAGVYEFSNESVILGEESRFRATLAKGLKEFEKGERDAFTLFTTYGFPLEMTQELAAEKGEEIDTVLFEQKMKEHQEKSRTSSAGQFKGGMSDANDPAVIKLHTAHHLLLAALQQVLGDEVKQRGSNITAERLRIDFTFDRKMTPEEKEQVEAIVNEKIAESLPVMKKEMPREEAEAIGAQMEFGQKYPDMVNVYFVGDPENAFSKEFCGGPHVENTSEIGGFKIKKEESSSKGIRRIKAVLQ